MPPSFHDYLSTAAGKAQMRAFSERVQARFWQDVSTLPTSLTRGAPLAGRDLLA